jgi:formylglycine-generating enzyme required for sulfatase activity
MTSNRLSELQRLAVKSSFFWIGAVILILLGLVAGWPLTFFEMSDEGASDQRRGDKSEDLKGEASTAQQGALFSKKDRAIVNDRWRWNRANKSQQDWVIRQVGRELGSTYRWVQTEDNRCNKQKHRIATFEHVRTGLLLNLIPGGKYLMGCNKNHENEQPVHEVVIERAFLMGRFEVRQSIWQKFARQNPSQFQGPGRPVEKVSWNDIQSWLHRANGDSAGPKLRLPSESEWEYACRAGASTIYSWGDEMDDSYCWYGKNSEDATQSVTAHAHKTNAFGLADMSGNVWEWCQDEWVDDYSKGPGNSRPLSGDSFIRVLRGGCWHHNAASCRSANREQSKPSSRFNNIGFRVARTL